MDYYEDAIAALRDPTLTEEEIDTKCFVAVMKEMIDHQPKFMAAPMSDDMKFQDSSPRNQ